MFGGADSRKDTPRQSQPATLSRIPRPIGQKPEYRRVDQRVVRPYHSKVAPTMARVSVAAPEHHHKSGLIPSTLKVQVSPDTDDIEAFLREKLNLQGVDHIKLTLFNNGQPVSFGQFKGGGVYLLTVEADPELEPELAGLVDDIHYQMADNYQPVAFSSLYTDHGQDSLTGQLKNVASGHCPAGVIDITSIWDTSQNIIQHCPDLESRIIPSPSGQGYQLIFWRKDSAAAQLAVDNYIDRQKSLGKQAEMELYLGTNREQVAANQKILQLQARKLLVGGDESWDQELQRLTRQEAARHGDHRDGAGVSTTERLEVFGERPEERIFGGHSMGKIIEKHTEYYPVSDRVHLENSVFLKQTLPRKMDSMLAPWQKRLARPMPKTRYGIEYQVKELLKQARKMEEELNRWYLSLKKLSPVEKEELEITNSALQSEYKLLLQVLIDPETVSCAIKGMNWNQAMEFKRLGYRLHPEVTQLSELNDQRLDKSHTPHQLRAGGSHTVYLIRYLSPDGTVEERVYKPVDTRDRSRWRGVIEEEMYLNPDCPFFTLRNMAAEKVSTAIGFPDLVPKIEFTEHEHQLGLTMTLAPGKDAADAVSDGDIEKMSKEAYWEMCCQINRLEWLDALCIQPDRHGRNYMVDPATGQVTGVDNDIGFSPNPDIVRASVDQSSNTEFSVGARIGFPLLVDRATLDGLRKLDIDKLTVEMGPLLSRKELAAMKQRYLQLLEHAEGLEQQGLCVEDWPSWVDPAMGVPADEYQMLVEKKTELFHTMYKAKAEAAVALDTLMATQGVSPTEEKRMQLQLQKTVWTNLVKSMEVAWEHSYLGELLRLRY